MPTILPLVHDFLAQPRLAVTGVSAAREDAANHIYRKLRAAGHEVYAVNPKLERFDGDPCYPDLRSLPAVPGGVVIVNRPAVAVEIVRQCIDCGVPRVWMHCMLGTRAYRKGSRMASASDEAVALCRAHGVAVIPGACPMMFCEPVDGGHRLFRFVHRCTGALNV